MTQSMLNENTFTLFVFLLTHCLMKNDDSDVDFYFQGFEILGGVWNHVLRSSLILSWMVYLLHNIISLLFVESLVTKVATGWFITCVCTSASSFSCYTRSSWVPSQLTHHEDEFVHVSSNWICVWMSCCILNSWMVCHFVTLVNVHRATGACPKRPFWRKGAHTFGIWSSCLDANELFFHA